MKKSSFYLSLIVIVCLHLLVSFTVCADGNNSVAASGQGYTFNYSHEGGGILGHEAINCMAQSNVFSSQGISVSGMENQSDDYLNIHFDGTQQSWSSSSQRFFNNHDCSDTIIDLSNLEDQQIRIRIKVDKPISLGFYAAFNVGGQWKLGKETGEVEGDYVQIPADEWTELILAVPVINGYDMTKCIGYTLVARDYDSYWQVASGEFDILVDWMEIGDDDCVGGPNVTGLPSSTDACDGESVQFDVTATGVTNFEWKKVGSSEVVSTNSSLIFPDVNHTHYGTYSVSIEGVCGEYVTAPVTLSPTTGGNLSFTSDPSDDQAVCLGATANLNISVSGAIGKWYKVGEVNSISNFSTHSFTVQSSDDYASYYCKASNSCITLYSDSVEISSCINSDFSGENSITPTGAGYVYNFAHHGGGIDLHENINCVSTSSNFTGPVTVAGYENSSSDYLKVTSPDNVQSWEGLRSYFFDEEYCDRVSINLTDPGNHVIKMRVKSDEDIRIGLFPFDSDDMAYDDPTYVVLNKNIWRTLTFPINQGSGLYEIDLTNVEGLFWNLRNFSNQSQAVGAEVNLQVDWIKVGDGTLDCVKPIISTQPDDFIVCLDGANSTTVEGSNYDEINWYLDGNVSVVATGTVLSIEDATLTDYGMYYAELVNTCGISTTEVIEVSERTNPIITSQPRGVPACVGESADFEIVGNDVQQLVWKKGGEPTELGTLNTLTFNDVQVEHYGPYYVELTNDCGVTFSDSAYLSACYEGEGNGENYVTNSGNGYVYNFAHHGGGISTHEALNCWHQFNIYNHPGHSVAGRELAEEDYLTVDFDGTQQDWSIMTFYLFDNESCFTEEIDVSAPQHRYIKARVKTDVNVEIQMYAAVQSFSTDRFADDDIPSISVEAGSWKEIQFPISDDEDISKVRGIGIAPRLYESDGVPSSIDVEILIDWIQIGDGVDVITEVKNTSVEEVHVLPNPSSGEFTISGTFEQVNIYSITGNLVKQLNSSESQTNLRPGIYLVQITQKNKQTRLTKLIVK